MEFFAKIVNDWKLLIAELSSLKNVRKIYSILSVSVAIYLFKDNNGITCTIFEVYSQKDQNHVAKKKHYRRSSSVFGVDFE